MRIAKGQRGEKLTILLAISPQNGIEKHSLHSGVITAARFSEFLHQLEEEVGEQHCIFIL